MLSRAFAERRRSPKDGKRSKSGTSISDYEDFIVGFTDDPPLISCVSRGVQMTMKEVLRSSVGVMGESCLGMTEKVVLLKGRMFAVKRFRKVIVGRSEFCKRVQKLVYFNNKCEYLVPINAYLYAKRIKFILCDYYPMGSLAELLAGGRKHGHTALNWNQRLKIILHIARAISFIHAQCPLNERGLQMNVHGNIKSSNVMINIDFSACLSDYGFTQLAERVEVPVSCRRQPPSLPDGIICEELSQKSDIYNFGVIILDTLSGSGSPGFRKCILEKMEKIKEGLFDFFEFAVEERERRRASRILDIALACTNRLPEARPSIEQVLLFLVDVVG